MAFLVRKLKLDEVVTVKGANPVIRDMLAGDDLSEELKLVD